MTNWKNRRGFLFFLLIFVLIGVGCVPESSFDEFDRMDDSVNMEENVQVEKATDISIALVTGADALGDPAINETTWFGVTQFAEENQLVKEETYISISAKTAATYYESLTDFAAGDFDLIFGTGIQVENELERVAEENRATKFVAIDEVIEANNIANMMFQDQEGAFLAGVVAALQTKSGKVGFIGGLETAVNERFESGFRAGIRDVNNEIEIEVAYTGSSTDVGIGKSIARDMYESGVDIIFQVAGEAGKGVFAEAKERKAADETANIWVIGSIVDQYDEGVINGTSVTLISIIKNYHVGVRDIATQTMRGKFPGGKMLSYGIQQGAFSVSDSREVLSKEITDQINIWRNEIVAGNVDCCG